MNTAVVRAFLVMILVGPENSIANELNSGATQSTYVIVHLEPPFSRDAYWELNSFRTEGDGLSIGLPLRVILSNDLKWNPTSAGPPELEKVVDAYLGEIELFNNFPFAGLPVKSETVQKLQNIPSITRVEQLPQSRVSDYLILLRAFDELLDREADVVNLSLQIPPRRGRSFDARDALHLATKALVSRGYIVVAAAGNFGGFGLDTMSELAIAPWVIAVGAASSNGSHLWEKSSRGIPGDPYKHPTVVASWAKSDNEANPTIGGTSFATAEVSAIASLCIQFIQERVIGTPQLAEWENRFALQFGTHPTAVTSSPDAVKRMIKDMARPIPAYGLHEVGAGFVSAKLANEYFETFSFRNYLAVFETLGFVSSGVGAVSVRQPLN